jgi:hypothetical protein
MTWKRQSNPTSGPQNNTKIIQNSNNYHLKAQLLVLLLCLYRFRFHLSILTQSIMQLFIIVVITLLLRFSESKTSPLNHLRGSPFHDDTHEHHEDEPQERALQKKCGGDIKTTLFKGNITMQSLLRPLQCTAEALVNIGIVLDLVFDEVVKENKALSPVNLNTTVCTTPTITTTKGNYFNRRLGAQSSAKYTYRAGKCTILF